MTQIDDLENSIDIVELVNKYTKLKKAGVNYKSLCPFPGHSEKTPSFVVSPAKQIAYCFGCHKGGGAIKFIMDMEGCDFRRAVEVLAQITGMQVPGFTQNKEKIELKKNLFNLYKQVQLIFKEGLQKTPSALEYLKGRQVTNESINKFGFGFAAPQNNIYQMLKDDYGEKMLVESQLFYQNKSSHVNKFAGRITFPIRNLRGDIVGFAGRSIDGREPKYLNSPASEIYDKSSILYGLFEARNSIVKNNAIILVEGYMDVITLHAAGFTNSVAISGTALTQKHTQIIKRFTKRIYLCFDNDKAGRGAVMSALETMKNNDLEVKVILMKGAKDPDEIIKKGKDFSEYIKNAVSPIGFYIETTELDLSSIDGKKQFLSQTLDMLSHYTSPIEQEIYLKELSNTLGLSQELIYQEFKKALRGQKITMSNEEAPNQKKSFSPEIDFISYLSTIPEENRVSIAEKVILPEMAHDYLKKYLADYSSIQNLDLDTKNYLRAMDCKVPQGEQEKLMYEQELISKLNNGRYKNKKNYLLEKLAAGEDEYFIEYNELLKKAQKWGLQK